MKKENKCNKYEDIEIMSFYETEDVNNFIDKKVDELDEDNDLVVYAKRDLIAELFINMINNDYDFGYINFDRLDDLRKNEVYIMTVSNERRVDIEHAYKNGRVVGHESKIALFYTDDCKQDIIDYCINSGMEVILFDFEDDEGYCNGDCGCEGCGVCEKCKDDQNTYESESTTVTVSKSKNGVPNGFTRSRYSEEDGVSCHSSYSFFCDDLGVLKDVAKEIGVKL